MPLQFYSAKRASLHKYMKHIHNYTQYFIQFKSEKKGHLIYYWTIFWTQLQVSLQIYHPGARATQLSPEETCYKAYILGKLKFSHCICIKLAVQVRFLPFFFSLCRAPQQQPRVLGLSGQIINNRYLILPISPLRFIKYLRNYSETPTKYIRVFWFALF